MIRIIDVVTYGANLSEGPSGSRYELERSVELSSFKVGGVTLSA
jgi:hypothetical protein